MIYIYIYDTKMKRLLSFIKCTKFGFQFSVNYLEQGTVRTINK